MDLDQLLMGAQKKLIDAVRDAREAVPVNPDEDRVMHYSLEAVTSVVPALPDAIATAVDRAMGSADARIFTRAQLREAYANLLVDMLVQQTYAISRWMRVRRRAPVEMRNDDARSMGRRSRG